MSEPQAQGQPAAQGKRGGLVGLIKRKPLEATAAAVGIVGLGLYLWYRHQQNAAAQTAPGTTAQTFRAPAGRPGPPARGGRGGRRNDGGSAALEAQIDQLQRSRDRDHTPPERRREPPKRFRNWGQ